MARKVVDLMTPAPLTVELDETIQRAAQIMRDADVGDVIVTDEGRLGGILTDRDITVRAVADGRDPTTTNVEEITTEEVVAVTPDTDIQEAERLMAQYAVRRLPVVDGDRPVGIVSLGDIVVVRDRDSVLADISAAPPNS